MFTAALSSGDALPRCPDLDARRRVVILHRNAESDAGSTRQRVAVYIAVVVSATCPATYRPCRFGYPV